MQSEAAQSGGDLIGDKAVLATVAPVRQGQLVRSIRGRDDGRWYMVIGRAPDGFIYVADGAQRSVSRPKRKNPKHLLVWEFVAGSVAASLAAGRRATDGEVREWLQEVTRSNNLDGEEVDDTGKARCD